MPRPSRDEFRIGWICALPIEAAAAKLMLDEDFGMLEEQDAADINVYTLGRIGKHNVVIACLPGGQYGTSAATTVANNMVRTFSNSLRVGLMVGIGGGIPSADQDIRLGDIVISCPVGTCGGVLQYNMGKVVQGGKFLRTGSMNSPPRALLTAINSLKASQFINDPIYPEYLENAIGKNARTRKNFGRPSPQSDRLFKPEYDHPEDDDHTATTKDCLSCPSEWEVPRSDREDNNPQPHYGIIASGNYVIKHGVTREKLRLETGALCFEMEAAGLMLDIPCIVIRGICDYSDSHKNKSWQGYAALAAASYTKDLLRYLPHGQVSHESPVADVCQLNKEIQGINQRLEKSYNQQERHGKERKMESMTSQERECHQVFKNSNYEDFKDVNPARAPGTCQWALKNPQYLRWRESTGDDLLWISADPGCGKSVLSKALVDEKLRSSASANPETSVCYFFFKDNEEQNSLAKALCAIIHQLLSQQPVLIKEAMSAWKTNGPNLEHEVGEMWRILMAASSNSSFSPTICVFDALDECKPHDQERLIRYLNDFHKSSRESSRGASLKFLVTSRPYDEIQIGFKQITDLFPDIHIQGEAENDQIHQEIDLVVKIKVKEIAEASSLPPEVHQRLEEKLLKMQHRTYLWLYLVIDDIRVTLHGSLWPSDDSIPLVPPSVDAAYAKILTRVPEKQTFTVRKILQIIVGARRPLTLREMATALGIVFTDSQTTPVRMLDPAQLSRKIRHLCGLFVFVSNSRIYLLHQTATEFLLKESSDLSPLHPFPAVEAEDLLAQICARSLAMMEDEEDIKHDQHQPCLARDLFEYSAEHWADHVRKMSPALWTLLKKTLYDLYDTSTARYKMWFQIFWERTHKPDPNLRKVPFDLTAIQLAAFNGHLKIVERLVLEDNIPADQTGENNSSALIMASWKGYHEICSFLLEHGADPDRHGDTRPAHALQIASSRRHPQVVKVLLAKGADPNIDCHYSRCPFSFSASMALVSASYNGDLDTIKTLLDGGANINSRDGSVHGTAIQAASCQGYIDVVRFLLENGANPSDSTYGSYGSALIAASAKGFSDIVKLLMKAGADHAYDDEDYGTALYAASRFRNLETVVALVQNGVDLNFQSGRYGSALKAASERGRLDIMQFLLQSGADVNGHGGRYDSFALEVAARAGECEAVKVLLSAGADINADSECHGNALTSILELSSQRKDRITFYDYDQKMMMALRLLLEHGADVNAHTQPYGSALNFARSRSWCEAAEILLEHAAALEVSASDNTCPSRASEGMLDLQYSDDDPRNTLN